MTETAATRAGEGDWEEAPAGEVGDVPEGGMKAVEVDGRAFVLFNLDGDLYAYRDQCPHQGAAISCGLISGAMLPSEPGKEPEYGLEGRVVICPRHRWKFSIETGETIYGADPRRLPSVPVRVENGRILIGVRRRPRSAGTVAPADAAV